VTRKPSELCNWKIICGEHLTEQATLEKIVFEVHTSDMTNKEIVEDLLRRIPDGASLHDIAQEIEFIAAVRQGLAELDRGERIPIEEVERELPSWIIK
jgi:predicted transcriptional regulator